MGDFFEQPILNSPYEYPSLHWKLDEHGQPTNEISDARRIAEFITPIPKPKKRKISKRQKEMAFDEGAGLTTETQQYDPTPVINEIRRRVDDWRTIPNPSKWRVTPETARLLQHWRHYEFLGIRPFSVKLKLSRLRFGLQKSLQKSARMGRSSSTTFQARTNRRIQSCSGSP